MESENVATTGRDTPPGRRPTHGRPSHARPSHGGEAAMLIPLTLARDQPLQQQLYDQLKGLIASARLRSGLRMPSTRVLAEQFAISRNTVLLTFERLVAEGY